MDAFAIMGLPRQPALDAIELKETFRQAAARLHPDSPDGNTAAFHDLNEAFAILRDPARRLRHLVELTFPDFAGKSKFMPEPGLFSRVHAALGNGDASTVKSVQSAITDRLREIDQSLSGLPATPAVWSQAAAEITFLQKWNDQLREKAFRLANR